jgi:acylpyruvate hydrolase
MRLATIDLGSGTTTAAVEVDGEWFALDAPDLSALLRLPDWRDATVPAGAAPLADPVFALPLPTPAKILCCGLNYAEHILEMGRELPRHPTVFAKFADTLVGPTTDVVVAEGGAVDWEAELAVVIGATLRRGDRAEASAAIAGYTVANDVSLRDWQNRTTQWLQGKAFDATTPIGPVLVTADELDPAAGLAVTCSVNGEEVQRGDTSDLVFDAAALVAYVSTFTTLRPGDIVLTGTPGGVGAGRTPPRFLRDGDVVETSVEGIGTLTNRFVIQH